MKLWIDNTGLQSASQCLLGRATPWRDHDVRGLLQLATQIVYGTSIRLNGFEANFVATKTADAIENLRSQEVGSDVISVSPIDETEYSLACETAARSVANNLASTFHPDEFRFVGGQPVELPRDVLERQVQAIALASEGDGSSRIAETLDNSLNDKAIGAVEYMIAVEPRLRNSIRNLFDQYPRWTDSYSLQLNIYLRAHLNHALADSAHSRYSPAIARAELINRRNEFILSKLGEEMDDIVEELRDKPLGAPSVWAALLERSKGELKPLISEALELRSATKSLRKALSKLTVDSSEESPSNRHEIASEVKELGQQIRRDLKLKSPAGFWDAFEVRFLLGIPAPSASGKALLKWAKEQWRRKQTAVLTDLAKSAAYSQFHSEYYETLRRASSARLRPSPRNTVRNLRSPGRG